MSVMMSVLLVLGDGSVNYIQYEIALMIVTIGIVYIKILVIKSIYTRLGRLYGRV